MHGLEIEQPLSQIEKKCGPLEPTWQPRPNIAYHDVAVISVVGKSRYGWSIKIWSANNVTRLTDG